MSFWLYERLFEPPWVSLIDLTGAFARHGYRFVGEVV